MSRDWLVVVGMKTPLVDLQGQLGARFPRRGEVIFVERAKVG